MNDLTRVREIEEKYGVKSLGLSSLISNILGATLKDIELTPDDLMDFNSKEEEDFLEMGFTKVQSKKLASIGELNRRFINFSIKKGQKITCPDDVADIFYDEFIGKKREHFIAVLLNTKSEVISKEVISIGNLNSTVVHPREVYRIAVKKSAASILFVHNHPSGNTKPSNNDNKITKRLVDAGKLMGISVMDHLIVGDRRYYSYREAGEFF